MSLSDSDRELIVAELGREITSAEEVLFENLWSEHCAYRSSRPLLGAFDSQGEGVVIGPGDDAAVVSLPPVSDTDAERAADAEQATDAVQTTDDLERHYITMGIESHNHPSYVDPYDGAATGVGGIVRDTLSMGAYPIALADSLYFGPFDRDHSQYLFEGVVEGIADYGNSIGVPTVAGSVNFHPGYEGNPLVNVACIGLLTADRLVTAAAQQPGNELVLVGNATGRDGLGGASFASEDLQEDAETADRPAVQVGDPYTEKLLIEANEALLDADVIESARDLGAAGLGGASSEMVGKASLGAELALDRVHQREPNMRPLEILLAESQERMCYEVRPENVETVSSIADRFDLGCSTIGTVTDTGRYVCTFDGEVVVDVPAEFLTEGAPMNDLDFEEPQPQKTDLPDVDLATAFEAVFASPNIASKRWVFRQYDHEVGARTAVRPGDDAALLAIRETGQGLAFTAGADPNWTSVDPYEGARAIALENATNLAAKGAIPLAAVDCLNGGNPEKPDVYGGFSAVVDGIADMCATLSIPVVGGNVSLYNDSTSGPIPPTPTLAMTGVTTGYDAAPTTLTGDGTLVLVGERKTALGGSEYLAQCGGTDRFPRVLDDPAALVDTLSTVAREPSTLAVHDVSHGGIAAALAEMVTTNAGIDVTIPGGAAELFCEVPGRAVIETTDPAVVETAFGDGTPTSVLGRSTDDGRFELTTDAGRLSYTDQELARLRSTIELQLE